MKTEIIKVTPEKAQEWLKHSNSNNRNLSIKLAKQYASDMRNGFWSLTHQGIAFYANGMLADGQHRLHAVVLSGCSIDFMVTFGLTHESGAGIDVHRSRTAADSIKIGGLSDWIKKEHIAVINYLYNRENATASKLTPHQIVYYADQIKEFLIVGVKVIQKKRNISTTPVISAVVVSIMNESDINRIIKFGSILSTGIADDPHDVAALRLREYLLNSSGGHTWSERKEAYLKSQRAIKAFVDRQKLSKLMTPSEPIYNFRFL